MSCFWEYPAWAETFLNGFRNRFYNVDVIGVLRGKYWSPAFAVKIGETAIRNCLRDQLHFLREESYDHMGHHPLIFTEIGIPYDLDDKYAYKTGDYSSQIRAMDANHYALEGSEANGYSIWNYTCKVSTEAPDLDGEEVLTGCLNRIHMSGEISGTAKTCPYSPWMTLAFRVRSLAALMNNHQCLGIEILRHFQRAGWLIKTLN